MNANQVKVQKMAKNAFLTSATVFCAASFISINSFDYLQDIENNLKSEKNNPKFNVSYINKPVDNSKEKTGNYTIIIKELPKMDIVGNNMNYVKSFTVPVGLSPVPLNVKERYEDVSEDIRESLKLSQTLTYNAPIVSVTKLPVGRERI